MACPTLQADYREFYSCRLFDKIKSDIRYLTALKYICKIGEQRRCNTQYQNHHKERPNLAKLRFYGARQTGNKSGYGLFYVSLKNI